MEPDISLPCSQQSATFPVPSHLIQSTPSNSLSNAFQYYSPIYDLSFQLHSMLQNPLAGPSVAVCPAQHAPHVLPVSDSLTWSPHTQILKGTVCLPPRTATVNAVKRLASSTWLNAAIRCPCHSFHFRFPNNMEPRWFSRCCHEGTGWPNDEHTLIAY